MDFEVPGKPSKCTWHLDADPKDSPHPKYTPSPRPKLLPNMLYAIGHTPLVKLNKIPESCGVSCDVYVKCEFLNPGGSVKDRIAYRMVEEAEKDGILKPGSTIIEPTSGNTGIGLALVSAIKGYRCILVMPEKNSNEKIDTIRALGAEIVKTPNSATSFTEDGPIGVSQRLRREIPNSVILDQYSNADNPLMHYDLTAEEILEDCDGQVDMIVMGAGTGGTATGLGRKLKEKCPDIKVVCADPVGSLLAEPEEMNKDGVKFFEVEGIGYDFIPTVLDRKVVDKWYKNNDEGAFTMARRLIKEEGILCGGSSGCMVNVAMKAAKELKEGQRCVVILPDGIRNYMTKLVSDQWMESRGHFKTEDKPEIWWWNHKVSNLKSLKPPKTILPTNTCDEAINMMKNENVNQIPVCDESGSFLGMVTKNFMMQKIVNSKTELTEPVSHVLNKSVRKVSLDATLGHLSRILEIEKFVVVVQNPITTSEIEKVIAVLTNDDLLDYITFEKNYTNNNFDGKRTHM